MLLKHVCPQCGHHYLADDQDANVDCPRCHAAPQEGWVPPGAAGTAPNQTRLPPDVPKGGYFAEPDGYDERVEPDPIIHTNDYGFDPLEPPPMALTSDRIVRGLASGAVGTLMLGLVIGGAFGAIGICVPAVIGLLIGLVAGFSCKRGFGARSSSRTRVRAIGVVFVAVLFGFVATFTGSWVVERYLAVRAEGVRADLAQGLRGLERQRGRTTEEGVLIVIDDRIAQVKQLQAQPSARLEDYLWVQQAQLWPAPLAYAKLRATQGPLVRLGPDSKAIRVAPAVSLAALGGEIAVAVLFGAWLVTSRRRR